MKALLWLLLLFGCQRHTQWHCQHVANCTRLLYASEDQSSGIDVELLQMGKELITYLQVHALLTVTPEEKVLIHLHTQDKHLSFLIPFHSGQQRVKLPDALQTELLLQLKLGNPITIELAGYRETLHPKSFQKAFKKLP